MTRVSNLTSPYLFRCTVPGLREPETSLLAQADCQIQGESVEFNLNRDPDEGSDHFRDRAAQWIDRELSRVNALTGRLLRTTSLQAEPSPGLFTVRADAAWDHQAQMPPSHNGWSNEAVQFRLSAWDTARHTDDPVLRFVMLDAICESASVSRDWIDLTQLPPRFAEVRLIRNLLVHGSPYPSDQVRQYLELLGSSIPKNRYSGRLDHIELARFRSAHLLSAVWKIVINDCIDIDVELFADEPASTSGTILLDRGPYPIENK
ncbi:MAG: hypothetical protein AB2588_08365 [Candidatus Thiodiazotropha sp.]